MPTEIHHPSARYSTREIASRVYLTETRTRHVLMALQVPYTRIGTAYAWDARRVEQVLSLLSGDDHTPPPAGALA